MTSLTSRLIATLAALCVHSAFAQKLDADGTARTDEGHSLYTFAKDSGGESRCHDGCATAWPPFMAAEGAQARGAWTLHARKGGGQQWGWKGQPLYRFAGDARPGDANGDGQGGVWHLARTPRMPAPALPTSSY
jgi:predicted lipoprotein with Yx(FWY)xxD motif